MLVENKTLLLLSSLVCGLGLCAQSLDHRWGRKGEVWNTVTFIILVLYLYAEYIYYLLNFSILSIVVLQDSTTFGPFIISALNIPSWLLGDTIPLIFRRSVWNNHMLIQLPLVSRSYNRTHCLNVSDIGFLSLHVSFSRALEEFSMWQNRCTSPMWALCRHEYL